MTALPEFGDPDVLYVIDVSGFVHPFWHVGPAFAGRNFASMVQKVVAQRGPARFVLAEDTVWPTFREEISPRPYKDKEKRAAKESGADRASKLEQLRIAGELVEDMVGARRISARGFEADDVIASLTSWAVEEGLRVVILAHDKDIMQLVTPSVTVWDGKDRVTGPEGVVAKFGVHPNQIIDFLAMVGDKTDNVPGLRGIGEVGAKQILACFGTLKAALETANDPVVAPGRGSSHAFFVSNPRIWARLVATTDDADLMRRLVRLRHDVPLGIESLDELRLP